MILSNSKYSVSITGASALFTETTVIAEEFEKYRDWNLVEKSLIDNNLLNKVKNATFKREFREIKKRLSLLTSAQLNVFTHGGSDDAKAMLLLALIKTYPLFKDFITEVLLIKYLQFDRLLTETDYTRFFYNKGLLFPELISITESTAKKTKQVIFKLLEQMGLITKAKNGLILKPILSQSALKVIIEDDPLWLICFLYTNEEIKRLQ